MTGLTESERTLIELDAADTYGASQIPLFETVERIIEARVAAERERVAVAIEAVLSTEGDWLSTGGWESRDSGQVYNAEGVDDLVAAIRSTVIFGADATDCSGCGCPPTRGHVYGSRKCCPDCDHR
ncbi:MAG: hypothetical protein JWP74_1739 [Marmoricola sp.]|nr:hypothetical protein [Marmoricola sp.]